MAVRLNAAADRLTHTGTYPQPSAGVTITGWVKIDTDQNDYTTFARLMDSTPSTLLTFSTTGDGTSGPAAYTPAGDAVRSGALALSTGVWVPIATTRNGATSKVYARPDGGATVESASGTVTGVTGTAAGICLGGRDASNANEWLDGELAYWRVWSVELTQAEIEAEWASATPVKTSGLVENWPLANATDLTGTVGSRTLAVQSGGSLTSTASPSPLTPAFPPPPDYTIYACDVDPSYGLTSVTADNTTDNAARLQAILDFVEDNWSGGTVVLRAPDGAGVKISSMVTCPKHVQLVSDNTTLINATAITTGPALYYEGNNHTPFVGIRMDGGLFSPSTSDYSSDYAGIKLAGHGLTVENLHLQYFARGVDLCSDDTFGIILRGGTVEHCATGLFLDHEGEATSNSGERITVDGLNIVNSVRGFWATGIGTDLFLTNLSLDFLGEVGKINNAIVYHVRCHVETSSISYLYDVNGNAQMFFTATRFVMGKSLLFKTYQGPANYGFGKARFDSCIAYFTDDTNTAGNVDSEWTVSWPASTTTKDVYVPWPLKGWSTIAVEFVCVDGYTIPNADRPLITARYDLTGKLTITAPSNGNQRFIKLKF